MAARTRGVTQDWGLGVHYASNTFIEGYEISTDVIEHAMNPLPLLLRVLRHEPDGEKILREWGDLTWQQIEPEKLPAWSLPPSQATKKRKYYGDQ